jgi:citrate lyase gamma subunit
MPFSQSSRNANIDLKIQTFTAAASAYTSHVNVIINRFDVEQIKLNIEQTIQKNQDARREHFIHQIRQAVQQTDALRTRMNTAFVALPDSVLKDARVTGALKELNQADDAFGDLIIGLNSFLKLIEE